MAFAFNGPTALYYEQHGDETGRYPVLCIPGLSGQGALWTHQVASLSTTRRTLTMDHRGCGQSARIPTASYSIDVMAEDAIAVLDAAGVERADLIGLSTGSAIAMKAARTAPNRIRRLVLSGAWSRPDGRWQRLFAFRKALLKGDDPRIAALAGTLLLYPPEYIRDHDVELSRMELETSIDAASIAITIARMNAVLEFDMDAELPNVDHEALVVIAADDVVTPPYCGRRVAQQLPNASYLELKTGAHFAPFLSHQQFNAAVTEFLNA